MKNIRRITCSNSDGYSVTFGERKLSPFLLVEADGCYEASNNVTVSENTMIDGGSYQGSVAAVRNIVLTVADNANYVEDRELLYRLFKAGERGRLVFYEKSDGTEIQRYTDYYVENIKGTGKNGSRTHQISLICPDPFFYDMDDVKVSMAAWISDFTFQHEFHKWEEIGHRSDVRLQDIRNDTATDGIGLTILIIANGTVKNPAIAHVEKNERLQIGSSSNPFTMNSGDQIRITTGAGDKHLYYTSVETGAEKEVSQYLTEESEFIQLGRGDNTIGYDAGTGVVNMTITISYRLRYAGA